MSDRQLAIPCEAELVEDAVMPWEAYQPPTDAAGRLVVDARREHMEGLVATSFGDRLRRNGVAEVALQTLVAIMQDPDAGQKVRLEASRILLDRAHGTPLTGGDRNVGVAILVNIDR